MNDIRHTLQLCFFSAFVATVLLNTTIFYWAVRQESFYPALVFLFLTIVNVITIIFLYKIAKRTILRPLAELSKELSIKTSSEIQTIDTANYPNEFQTMLQELNQLFVRVHADYDRNKRFSADAAHELRTPMTALKTQAQLALQVTEPDEQKKAIENVIISINRSIHVIQQLLTLSRLDHEQKLNDVSDVNLENIAAELIAFMYPQALERNIDIELCNECKHPKIKGNEASLGILLRNLIDNAIRYSPDNTRIYVKIFENDESIMLEIVDNGPGISSEYQDKVFDRFFRVLGTKQTGSGLGLAIVKQIADLHKAKIHLKTSDAGQGLSVTVVFKKLI